VIGAQHPQLNFKDLPVFSLGLGELTLAGQRDGDQLASDQGGGAAEAQPTATNTGPDFHAARPSPTDVTASLIHLRSETFGTYHTGQTAEVTDPPELRRTPVHSLGKRAPACSRRTFGLQAPDTETGSWWARGSERTMAGVVARAG